MRTFDTVVIGGGVIGLSLAYELKLKSPKMKVAVLDKGQCGREASWAAAGMLSPDIDGDASDDPLQRAFLNLCTESRLIYEDFVRQLEHVGQSDVELRKEGALKLLSPGENPDTWLEAYAAMGIMAKYWDVDEAEKNEPALAEGYTAVYLPNYWQLDNRKLVQSLYSACKTMGVDFFEYYPVLDVHVQNEVVESIACDKDSFSAAVYVLTAGAWSSIFSSLTPVVPELRPVKGQIAVLQMPKNDFIRRIGLWKQFYYVPRRDGRLIVGSTLEDAGFIKSVSDHVVQTFHDTLEKLIPNSVFFSPIDKWAGLRPATSDRLPILGSTALANLKIATGHYRNGILLAPITARLVAKLVTDGQASPLIEPFSVFRFFDEDTKKPSVSN